MPTELSALCWLKLRFKAMTVSNIVWSLTVGKGEAHRVICRESKDGEYRYSCTLSLTFALDGGWWSTSHPDRFIPGNVPVPTVQGAGRAPGRLMVGSIMYDELKKTWKRRVVAYLSYYPSICSEGLRKIMNIHMPWSSTQVPPGCIMQPAATCINYAYTMKITQ
jgi:hypothetical protein